MLSLSAPFLLDSPLAPEQVLERLRAVTIDDSVYPDNRPGQLDQLLNASGLNDLYRGNVTVNAILIRRRTVYVGPSTSLKAIVHTRTPGSAIVGTVAFRRLDLLGVVLLFAAPYLVLAQFVDASLLSRGWLGVCVLWVVALSVLTRTVVQASARRFYRHLSGTLESRRPSEA